MPRTRLLPVLSAAWFVVVLLAFHSGPGSFPAGGIGLLLADVALMALVAAASWGLGALLLRPLRLGEESAGEAPLFEIGAGLGSLALSTLLLASMGLLYRWAALGLLGLGVLALWMGRAGGRPRALSLGGWRPGEVALVGLVLFAGAITLAGSLAPPEFYDALIYHLALPDLYVRHHGLVPVADNFYAGYPANMGMLYALGLLLHGGELAQSLHWLTGALAAAALASLAARHMDRLTALVACALFAVTPGVMLVATWAIADLAVTLFATLCFAAVLNRWMGGDRRWVVAAGIFAGLALGTKYTAAILVFAPAAAALALRPWMGRPAAGQAADPGRAASLRDLAIFAGLAAALMTPWLARNLVYTGNPVAPYFSGQLSQAQQSATDLVDEIQRRLPRDAGPGRLAWHYLASPWTASMERLGAGGYLGAAFLMLIPALLLMRGLPRAVVPLSILAGAAFVGWAVSSQVTRYLFPALPLLALMAAMAAVRLPRLITVPALGWSLLYNVYLFVALAETIGLYRVVAGAEDRETYLSRRVSYYSAAAFLAQGSPPQARVLFVGEGRGLYCPREYTASTPLDALALDRHSASTAGGAGLAERLNADGYTHLLVSGPELQRTRGMTADDLMRRYFPEGTPRLLFQQHDVRVYALTGP